MLKTRIGTVEIRNPLILASGIIGSSYSAINRMFKAGLGAVVTKSVGMNPRSGHPNPSVIYLPEIKSVLNAVGLANPGCQKYSESLSQVNSEVNFIISVYGASPSEFADVIKIVETNLKRNKPIAFELNLSCPHAEKLGMAVGTDPEMVENIITSVKENTKTPIWVKLTPNITDISVIGESAFSAGADAIVAINAVKAIAIDVGMKKPILSNIRGGLTGKAIKPIGLRAIYDLYGNLGSKIPLIGVGGVSSWKDVIEYILAGANAVELGSVFSNQLNPEMIINTINEELTNYLKNEEISLEQLRGLAHE